MIGDAPWRVPGEMDHFGAQIPDLDERAVFKEMIAWGHRAYRKAKELALSRRVLHEDIIVGMKVDGGVGFTFELGKSGDMVHVGVGLKNLCDLQTVRRREGRRTRSASMTAHWDVSEHPSR